MTTQQLTNITARVAREISATKVGSVETLWRQDRVLIGAKVIRPFMRNIDRVGELDPAVVELSNGRILRVELTRLYSTNIRMRKGHGRRSYQGCHGKAQLLVNGMMERYSEVLTRLHYRDHNNWSRDEASMLCISAIMDDLEFQECVPGYKRARAEAEHLWGQWIVETDVVQRKYFYDAILMLQGACEEDRSIFRRKNPERADQWRDDRARVMLAFKRRPQELPLLNPVLEATEMLVAPEMRLSFREIVKNVLSKNSPKSSRQEIEHTIFSRPIKRLMQQRRRDEQLIADARNAEIDASAERKRKELQAFKKGVTEDINDTFWAAQQRSRDLGRQRQAREQLVQVDAAVERDVEVEQLSDSVANTLEDNGVKETIVTAETIELTESERESIGHTASQAIRGLAQPRTATDAATAADILQGLNDIMAKRLIRIFYDDVRPQTVRSLADAMDRLDYTGGSPHIEHDVRRTIMTYPAIFTRMDIDSPGYKRVASYVLDPQLRIWLDKNYRWLDEKVPLM